MRLPSKDELEMYQRWGVEAPSHDEHGTIEEIREKMERVKVTKWTMEGNQLIGETNFGPLRQTVPTDYILIGTDKKGLPLVKKVVL